MGNTWSRGHKGERERLWIWLFPAVLQVLTHDYLCLLAFLFTRLPFWKQVHLGCTVLRLYIFFPQQTSLTVASKFL